MDLAEPFISIRVAAARLQLPIFKLRRAVKAGIIPTYYVVNKRQLVRLSEVVAAIERTRKGGDDA